MDFLQALEELRTPFCDMLFSLITHLGEESLFMIVSLVFFWCVDKHSGYYLLFAGFLGTVCIQFAKMVFRIPRPWVLDPDFTIVESARAEATGYSFPSGHTQIACTLYGGIARSSKMRLCQIGGTAVCLLIAFSRMYLGVHTPKDVLVSLAIGAAWVLLLYPIIEKTRQKPNVMYILIGIALLLTVANLMFVELYRFPAGVDAENLHSAKDAAWKLFAAIAGMCVLYPVEQKYIRFDPHAVWWAQLLKLVGGVALILAVRVGLKTPLNALLGVYVGGALRYFLMVLAAGLLWPLTFRFFSRLGNPSHQKQ